MSNDIRSIAYSESPTLSGAMALMAKRRNDLDAAMRAAADRQMPIAGKQAAEQRALEKITPVGVTQQLLDVKV
jgi:hypothetical protein